MSTTTNKIDPTVTLEKLIALLQGFKEKLNAGGGVQPSELEEALQDYLPLNQALGDTETMSKYYNKYGGGRALAGAILEVDGKVAAKADKVEINAGSVSNMQSESTTIEGLPVSGWECVPPEFTAALSSEDMGNMWDAQAVFMIPHFDTGTMVPFPTSGTSVTDDSTGNPVIVLRPFCDRSGRLVSGTAEVENASAGLIHFRWKYIPGIDDHAFVINCDDSNTTYDTMGMPSEVRIYGDDAMKLWLGLAGIDGDYQLYDRICFNITGREYPVRLTLPVAYTDTMNGNLYLGSFVRPNLAWTKGEVYTCRVEYDESAGEMRFFFGTPEKIYGGGAAN